MRILGIPVTPPCYGLDCVMTNAQVLLMACDVPVITYDDDKGAKTDKTVLRKPSESRIRQAADLWRSKYSAGNAKVNIKDI